MRIDVWSDIACPWCWLGKHHLEEALRLEGVDAEITMRSFELDPMRGPTQRASGYLAAKLGGHARVADIHARLEDMGKRAGIAYDFARANVANTFDAHRVHHLAISKDLGPAVVERFMRAYHAEGADLADRATISQLAQEAGLAAEDVARVLGSDEFAEDVRRDELEARGLGIGGVPYFVFDEKYALGGAQPVDVFRHALRTAQDGG